LDGLFSEKQTFTVTLGRFANDGCSTVEPSPSGSAHWDVSTLMPGAELLEYICQENNQDLPPLQGPAREPDRSKTSRKFRTVQIVP